MMITILTHAEEVQSFEQMISALELESASLDYKIFETYDDFIEGFALDSEAVIIARRGADGMECARNARLIKPSAPLVWLSDDKGFGIESYRIGCTFFSAEPITQKLINTAIQKCQCPSL